MIFPSSEPALLSWITLQWPSPLMLFALASLEFARRRASATSRALSVAVAAMVMLHLFAWLAYGSQDSLHAACAAIGLMLILPISLRAREYLSLVVAACVLICALSLACAGLVEPSAARAARLIAGLANSAMLGALWGSLLVSQNRKSRHIAPRQTRALGG